MWGSPESLSKRISILRLVLENLYEVAKYLVSLLGGVALNAVSLYGPTV